MTQSPFNGMPHLAGIPFQQGANGVWSPTPSPALAAMERRLAGQVQPPPPPGPQPGHPWCECCERQVPTPYNHTQHDPPHLSWEYCQECYDEGCEGPFGDGCYVDFDPGDFPVVGRCHICADGKDWPLGTDGWCINHLHLYEEYLESHPIPPKDRFTPTLPGEVKPLAHQPAYLLPPNEWPSIDFKPEYLLDPSTAPKPTARKKAHIVNQPQPTTGLTEADVLRLIAQAGGAPAGGPSTAVTIDDVLESIDPRDSDTALKLFHWLRDNARLHKIATLDQGGYLFMYQEPEGSSRQGYVAGGTQGDRIVDEAVAQAQASGQRVLRGLCTKCLSAVTSDGTQVVVEHPAPGRDPAVCADGNPHEMTT